MTVQEVIEYLEQHGFIADEVKDMCIEALVQVEQYRALGTVEEIKKKIQTELPYMSLAQAKFKSELDEYRNIGTVEELKEAREFKKYFDELYGEGLEIANWHKNGDLEPFDSFYESALEWGEEDD